MVIGHDYKYHYVVMVVPGKGWTDIYCSEPRSLNDIVFTQGKTGIDRISLNGILVPVDSWDNGDLLLTGAEIWIMGHAKPHPDPNRPPTFSPETIIESHKNRQEQIVKDSMINKIKASL